MLKEIESCAVINKVRAKFYICIYLFESRGFSFLKVYHLQGRIVDETIEIMEDHRTIRVASRDDVKIPTKNGK